MKFEKNSKVTFWHPNTTGKASGTIIEKNVYHVTIRVDDGSIIEGDVDELYQHMDMKLVECEQNCPEATD